MNPDEIALSEKRFEGSGFAPGLPGSGAKGKLQITPATVRFESAQGNLELPVEGLQIAAGGANDDLIFFSHPTQPQTTIHTADQSVFQHPVLASNPALAMQGQRAHSKSRRATTALLSVVGVLIACVVVLVMSKNWLVKVASNSVPVDWEVKAGDTLFAQFIKTKQPVNDETIKAQLEKITAPLVDGIGDKRYPLKFHIIEDASLNAFAMPGGNVVLHTGLLLAADTPEEVAGVLAHEIAHVTQRHSIRNLVSSAGLSLVLQSLVGDASGLIGLLAANSEFLLDRKFSRDFEREADEVGWDYLIRSDIKPEGMIRFFERVREEDRKVVSSDAAQGALSVVSTHPATTDRIEAVQAKWQRIAKKSGYREFDLDYAAFKTSLKSKLGQSGN